MQEDRSESRDNHMSSTLVIMRFDEPLAGEYSCVASNVFRMKKKSIVIRGTYMSVRHSDVIHRSKLLTGF